MCWDRSIISSSLFGKLECLRRQSRHTQTNLVTTVQCGHWAPPQTSSPKIYTRRKWILNPPNGWQPIHSRPYWMEESLKEPVDYYYIATSDVKHPTQINTPEMQQQSNKSYTHVLLSFFYLFEVGSSFTSKSALTISWFWNVKKIKIQSSRKSWWQRQQK